MITEQISGKEVQITLHFSEEGVLLRRQEVSSGFPLYLLSTSTEVNSF